MERGGPIRTVLIDDDDDIRLLARAALGTDPRFVVVGEACDGAHGVTVAADTAPDLVLLDLEMPWLHGAEAVPYIRAAVPDAVIVIWTVRPDGDRAREAAALGASTVLDKGFFVARGLAGELAAVMRARSAA